MSLLREVASVLCRRDCSQLILSQGTAPDHREQLGPVTDPGRCGRIWCEFLTARATPYTATCWPASPIADESRRIQGPTRVGPNGRDLKLPHGNSDRTTGPKLGSSFLLSVLSRSTAPSGRLPYLRPGRRVGLCCEATRAPSQGQHRMGRHEAALCHSGLAPKRQIASPALLPSARAPTPHTLSCFSPSLAPASATARHSA